MRQQSLETIGKIFDWFEEQTVNINLYGRDVALFIKKVAGSRGCFNEGGFHKLVFECFDITKSKNNILMALCVTDEQLNEAFKRDRKTFRIKKEAQYKNTLMLFFDICDVGEECLERL